MTVDKPRIAVATCSVLPNLDPDNSPLVRSLNERGAQAKAAVWDDPDVDWSAFDLVVLRSTWDYTARQGEFVSWAESVPRILNPEPVIRWNTDKRYLRELETAGVPVIPTLWLDPARNLTSQAIHTRLPAHGDFVIKPVVSAGARDTGRYQSGEAHSRGLAIQHVRRLLAEGRHLMVQPYIRSIDTVGEFGVVFIDGEFSHAVRSQGMLTGSQRRSRGLGLYNHAAVAEHEVTAEQLAVAEQTLVAAAAATGMKSPSDFLYARVDLVTNNDDKPALMELELTEPSLFLAQSEGALGRLADAILARTQG